MKNFVLFILLFVFQGTGIAQVCISLDGSMPDNSAMLQLKSDSLGFLPPRMSDAQKSAISNAKPGTIIYNTTHKSLDFVTGTTSNGNPVWTSVSGDGVFCDTSLFQISYGDTMTDYFKDIVQTGDGGYLAVGTFEVYDDYYLGNVFHYLMAVKLKSDGTLDRNFNPNGSNYGAFIHCFLNENDYNNNQGKAAYKKTYGESVILTHNRNYLISGGYNYGVAVGDMRGNFYFIELNSSGKLYSYDFYANGNMSFGSSGSSADYGKCVIESFDGKVVGCGVSSNWNYGPQAQNCQIVKLEYNGGLDYTFNSYGNIGFGTDGVEEFEKIIQTSDSGYVAVGYINNSGIFIAKLKPDGTPDTDFNSSGYIIVQDNTNNQMAYANDLMEAGDGNYLVAGYCNKAPSQNYSVLNALVLKISPSGTPVQQFGYNGALILGAPDNSNYQTYCYGITKTKDGGFAITGKTNSREDALGTENFPCNIFVAKFDENGNLDSHFGHNGVVTIGTDTTQETAYSIKQTTSGDYIVAGKSNILQANGNQNGFVAKIKSDGSVCANGDGANVLEIKSGINFTIQNSGVTTFHGGSLLQGLKTDYHKGNLTTICN